MQFDFKVENKILTPLDGECTVIADNSDYFVSFTFDDEWVGKTKTVRFINGGNYVDVILPSDNRVAIPIEVMAPPLISVGVYAGHLRTSSAVNIKCRTSILTPSGTPKAPTKDIYGQLISQYDTVKNKLEELDGDVDVLISSAKEMQTEEEKRQTAEAERQLMYNDFKQNSSRFSNAYVITVNGTQTALTVNADHCIVGDEPLEFYIPGKITETVPSGGKSPEHPSTERGVTITTVSFGSIYMTYSNEGSVVALPGVLTDIFDIKNGKFIHNIGIAEFHHLDGEIYLFDTVRGMYGKRYSLRRVESNSDADVFTDSHDSYPFGKEGMKTFSPHFKTADTVDGCEHGYMYDGSEHYFGFGEKHSTDEEAYIAFYQFVKECYEKGAPLKIYYEYSEPYVVDIAKADFRFTSSVTSVGARRIPFVLKYNADLNSLVNSLQGQINELTSSLVAIAEGGEG